MSEKRQRKHKPGQPVRRDLSFVERVIVDLLEMPRIARIFVVTFFALALTLVLSPIIDAIYLDRFFDERTVIVPSLVAAAFGFVMYAVGWVLVVGWQGSDQRPRASIFAYVLVGMLAVVGVILFVFVTLL